MSWALVAFVGYLVAVAAIGVWSYLRRTRTSADFFLGERKMGQWVVALSAVASGRSAWLVIGLSGMAYSLGLSAVWAAVGYIVVEMFQFVLVGRRLRRYTQRRGLLTVPAFVSERLGDRRHILVWLSALMIVFFFFFYVAGQLVGGAKAFSQTFQTSSTTGLLLTAAIVVAYTVAGGFVAVSWTDVVQALMMIVALVVLPAVAVSEAGGLSALVARLQTMEAVKAVKGGHAFIAGAGMLKPFCFGAGFVIGMIGIGLGSPGNPHILVRYMSVSSPGLLRRCCLIGTIWNVVMAWGAVFAGLAARYFFAPEALTTAGRFDRELGFVLLAGRFLPPVLVGLVMAAIVAAIMSTVDSQLLVISSSITADISARALGRRADDRRVVMMSRIVIVLVVLGAVLFAWAARGSSVFDLVLLAWGGLGSAFGPVIVLGLFWRRFTLPAAVTAMLVGPAVTVPWKLLGFGKTLVYELVPGFGAALAAAVVVSLLTRPPDDVDAHFADMAPQTSGDADDER